MKNTRLIVALDTDNLKKAETLVRKLKPYAGIFKIGSELFTAAGPEAICMVHKAGCRVFLDLKFHDIPNTVARAARAAVKHKVFMFNVHASGGEMMMKEAARACRGTKTKVLAVTILTSIRATPGKVLSLAKMAKQSGLDGVVCSAHELKLLRKKLGRKFLLVTPGIRPAGSARGDQKRIATPEQAIKNGADYIVVGRPITEAKDPAKAAREIASSPRLRRGSSQ